MSGTVQLMDGYSITEYGQACRSPNGEHVWVMGEIRCQYCTAERHPNTRARRAEKLNG